MSTPNSSNEAGAVQHLNPDTLAKNPAFTQAIVVTGAVKTVYVGGLSSIGQYRPYILLSALQCYLVIRSYNASHLVTRADMTWRCRQR